MKFIYALNDEDRELLKLKGYVEVFTSEINGNNVYAFDNTMLTDSATFSEEDKNRFLITDVAFI